MRSSISSSLSAMSWSSACSACSTRPLPDGPLCTIDPLPRVTVAPDEVGLCAAGPEVGAPVMLILRASSGLAGKLGGVNPKSSSTVAGTRSRSAHSWSAWPPPRRSDAAARRLSMCCWMNSEITDFSFPASSLSESTSNEDEVAVVGVDINSLSFVAGSRLMRSIGCSVRDSSRRSSSLSRARNSCQKPVSFSPTRQNFSPSLTCNPAFTSPSNCDGSRYASSLAYTATTPSGPVERATSTTCSGLTCRTSNGSDMLPE
ncbi:hypothetical protein V1517DRAFT_5888 [Lipomyces orientalis]|uniref:Uncharacterized protein n=1 Tax=Lipomyces orientalis TaxID=1233043 RepID=A0ACC3TV91_9ASCO